MRTSNLAHIPKQITWNAAQRGRQATAVKSRLFIAGVQRGHYTNRKNRPDQQTFCCQVCGEPMHANQNAARNRERRWGNEEWRDCQDRHAIKAVLMQRHKVWNEHTGWS